jgi:uncharacterized protein
MLSSFALASFLMGIAGGPHCIAMCGGMCAYIQQNQPNQSLYLQFHLGRVVGYAILGAVAAMSVKSLAWFSGQTASLHPLWTFFHTLVFAWGLLLLLFARQPVWVDAFGKNVWDTLKSATRHRRGLIVTGMLWALMPCGLLYSALLVASLQANALNGAVSMASFALGSSIFLIVGPTLWAKLKNGNGWLSDHVSMRLAGLFLCIVSGIAIWMDVFHHTKIWCV